MTRNRLMIGVAVLVLLGAIAVFAFGLPPETTGVDQERAVEETIAVSDQPAGEPNVGLAPPTEEATTFTLTGYVIVDAYHYDAATGTYVHFYHDESSNIITQIGYDFIAQQLSGVSADDRAIYIALSLDTTASPPNTWTQIPNEISADTGLDRLAGDYAHTALADNWTITKEFTAGAAFTGVQMTGLHWLAGEVSDSNLMAANHFDPVNLGSGDTLTITWTLDLVP